MKAILFYRMIDPNVSIQTVDLDEGIGIIKPFSKQHLFTTDKTVQFEPNIFCASFDFNFLCEHRRDILNLLTVEEWKKTENS